MNLFYIFMIAVLILSAVVLRFWQKRREKKYRDAVAKEQQINEAYTELRQHLTVQHDLLAGSFIDVADAFKDAGVTTEEFARFCSEAFESTGIPLDDSESKKEGPTL